MSFLQPLSLLALPLILLPIVIHLINQRRFQTVPWAAMTFLLAANRVSHGHARLRRWLILAARTAAVAGLVFAVSRPLSSGWLGLAGGGRVDRTIVLLDRSPSMTMRDHSGTSKLEQGLRQITESLQTLGGGQCVLIDSVTLAPIELDSPLQLLTLPQSVPADSSADLPAMMAAAHDYININRPGRCDVWICSDIQAHDWQSDRGRWQSIRRAFSDLQVPIQFQLLALTATPDQNRAVRVTSARQVETPGGSQLLLSLFVSQDPATTREESLPIQLELNGARSEFTLPISGERGELHDHAVPIDAAERVGWGCVTIAPDSIPADNRFYFAYDAPLERKTIIVAAAESATAPLEFAASVSPAADLQCSQQTITPDLWLSTTIDDAALVIWCADLPAPGTAAQQQLDAFVDRGGCVLFFPPPAPSAAEFAGLSWTGWQPRDAARVTDWVGDQDLLSRTLGGDALPVAELKFDRTCGIAGEFVALAKIADSVPLLVRGMDGGANVYFCGTTVAAADSSLAENGVVLYAMIHRALETGVQSLGASSQQDAGRSRPRSGSPRWNLVAGDPATLSTEYSHQAGVYSVADRVVAINRPLAEDAVGTLSEPQLADIFAGLDFNLVEVDNPGSGSLVQEIWRLCLLAMLAALIMEAVLCLPRKSISFA
jgi:hypothetical protein